MLDSGADTTVLDENLIQPGMRLKKPPEANAGNATVCLAENVPVQISNYSVTLSVVAFSRLSEQLVHDYGIQGILSAPALLRSAALLFDFPHNEILGFATTDDLRARLRDYGPAMSILRLPVRNTEGELFVEAAIAGHVPTWLLLDTGGGHTYFPRLAVGALNAGAVKTYSEFNGRSKSYLVVPDQSIVIAGHTFGPMAVTTRAELRGGSAEEEGRLGIDFLRGFAVAFPKGEPREIWLVMRKS